MECVGKIVGNADTKHYYALQLLQLAIGGDSKGNVLVPATAPPGAEEWESDVDYTTNFVVINRGRVYVSLTNHTSGPANEPGYGGDWQDYWSQLADDVIEVFNWTEADLSELIGPIDTWSEAQLYAKGKVIKINELPFYNPTGCFTYSYWLAKTNHTSATSDYTDFSTWTAKWAFISFESHDAETHVAKEGNLMSAGLVAKEGGGYDWIGRFQQRIYAQTGSKQKVAIGKKGDIYVLTAALTKYDRSGETVWTKTAAQLGVTSLWCCIIGYDGFLYVHTNAPAPWIALIKVNPIDGSVVWTQSKEYGPNGQWGAESQDRVWMTVYDEGVVMFRNVSSYTPSDPDDDEPYAWKVGYEGFDFDQVWMSSLALAQSNTWHFYIWGLQGSRPAVSIDGSVVFIRLISEGDPDTYDNRIDYLPAACFWGSSPYWWPAGIKYPAHSHHGCTVTSDGKFLYTFGSRGTLISDDDAIQLKKWYLSGGYWPALVWQQNFLDNYPIGRAVRSVQVTPFGWLLVGMADHLGSVCYDEILTLNQNCKLMRRTNVSDFAYRSIIAPLYGMYRED